MKAKKHRFDDVPKYRTWVKTRDRALEQLHTNAQMRASDVMRDALTAVLQTARAFYGSKANPDVIEHFDHYIKVRFHAANNYSRSLSAFAKMPTRSRRPVNRKS